MRTDITLTTEERVRLASLIADRNSPSKVVWRARIVLASADGEPIKAICRATGKSKPCVWRWQKRFAEEGVDGLLRDKTRPPGRKPLSSETKAKVLAKTARETPPDATHWSVRTMAKAMGVSRTSVQRIWAEAGLKPHLTAKFKVSNDPHFEEKVTDIVGLYMNPPDHALVLCVDEKSQIQALDRTQPGLPLKRGRAATAIRERWPSVSIVIRADSGFCRDDLMSWCEENGVKYVLGLAGNSRLVKRIARESRKAKLRSKRTAKPARVFADFEYRTRESWSRKRRVIGKAEWTRGEANPRFIVTNVDPAFGAAQFMYERIYCQRGEMENRLKECQGDLFADRTSAPTMRANQLRLWLASFAYVLICAVRRIGLVGTKLEAATCGTIRLQLLKIGALVTISVRRVKLAFASACPAAEAFVLAQRRLCG